MRSKRGGIAVVGMACRFPGLASNADEFWQLLRCGRDAVTEVDDQRWSKEYYYHPDPKSPGRSYTWSAGLLENIDRFDAAFFGISPREAAQMDPQQRLLLELSWEALEDGGQVPERLAGSDCSVFVGVSATDYANSRLDDPSSGDAYVMTGGTLSIAANRLSYFFDLHGPSMAIDTACSSSLVALHQACQSIWRGETTKALTGGVNVLLTPFNFIGFSKASMLSPNGRCRAFDASGDGYVRAEGGAMLFLKPLSLAKADGDPIHAVIMSSVVNSDGRTKGLSMPNSQAQESLLRSAYEQAGVDQSQVAYLEAHGTGTAAGDPQEAGAIGRAIGQGRGAGNPLPIGSVKTNIGHLEPASGMAGFIKVVLSLKHRAIPPSLHFDQPNPSIDFDDLNLQVVTELTPIERDDSPVVMGVNSFGFGGTNAHVVLRGHAPRGSKSRSRAGKIAPPLLISARSEAALDALARRYRDQLSERAGAGYYDVAYTSATRRERHPHRLVVAGDSSEEILSRLTAFCEEGRAPGVVTGRAATGSAKLALLFSGNGSQWAGMGRGLLASEREFRRALDEIDELFRPLSGFSIVDELERDETTSRYHLTEIAQPALFALQVGLLRLLRRRGVRPQAVLGHSVGEVAAAHACGALSLEQAVRVIFHRSAAQALTRGQGKMAAAALTVLEAESEIGIFEGAVEIAAVNSPTSVTLSGPLPALEALQARLSDLGRFFRILDLDYAFHSRAMDPVRDGLVASLAGLEPESCDTTFVSTVTGTPLDAGALGAEYWWDNIRRPVRLDTAVETLIKEDVTVFLEVGPSPIMQTYLRESLRAMEQPTVPIPTLQKSDTDEPLHVVEAVGLAYAQGCELDPNALFPVRGSYEPLPLYPWQRESYWYELTNEQLGLLGQRCVHPLLGHSVIHTEGEWENQIDVSRFPFLADHVVGGAVVFPAAGFIEMALAASATRSGDDGASHEIENLEIRAPLVLNEGETKVVRFSLSADGTFTIRSRPRLLEDTWVVHVVGRLAGASSRRPLPVLNPATALPENAPRVLASDHYRRADAVGLTYGPAFQGVVDIRLGEREALARVGVPDAAGDDVARYHLHPAVVDACLQVLVDVCAQGTGRSDAIGFLPFQVARTIVHDAAAEVAWCRVKLERQSARSLLASFELYDESGRSVVELEGFRFRRMRLARSGHSGPSLYEFRPVVDASRDVNEGTPLPSPADIVEWLVPELTERWYTRRRAEYYGQVLPLLDALVVSFAYRAMIQLLGERSRFTLSALTGSAGIAPERTSLLAYLLKVLEEDGLAHREGEEWILDGTAELASPEEIWRLVLADFPAYLPEVTLLGSCGTHLGSILRGERGPEELLNSAKAGDAFQTLFDASPTHRITMQAVKHVLEQVIGEWPSDRRLRILEVGSGALGLASELAPVLCKDRCDYVLACSDERAQARAAAELGDRPNIAVAGFDLDAGLAIDTFGRQRFDVVILSHVLHDTSDPNAALDQIRQLLHRDGLAMVLERPPERASDLIFGIRPQWWVRGQDALRPISRLRSVQAWCDCVASSGFVDAVSVSEPAPDVAASSYLVLARNPESVELPPEHGAEEPRSYLLVSGCDGDSHAVSVELAGQLTAEGHRVLTARAGAALERHGGCEITVPLADPDALGGWLEELGREGPQWDEVVYLAALSLHDDERAFEDLDEMTDRCAGLAHLVQGLCAAGWTNSPKLWLATCGATAIEGSPEATVGQRQVPSQAPVWGMGRVLMNEHPDLGLRLVDLELDGDPGLAATLLSEELARDDAEDEVVLTPRARYVLRLSHAEIRMPEEIEESEPDRAYGVRLDFDTPGPLSNLRWTTVSRRRPERGEIEIRVRATGLNFRDVMYAMGMLSDEAVENGFAGATLGMECAGDVVAVGPDVTGFKVGDEVMCFARACFSSYVTTSTTAVTHKPSSWSYEEAATVPSTFFTVYYSLHHLAHLQPGERILVHGAAGGVGMAAIQYARYCGAEIFATAGSEEKRNFLRMLGVEHVLDSRSLAFADEVLALTGGQGVDVVLNSLSGEAVLKNLNVLRPFGRFLELGKRDFYENSKIGLRPFRNNISYFGIDADQLLMERPSLAGRLFRDMMELFERGAFRPLVHRVFPNGRAADAFRYMQQSGHIGKIVVSYDDYPSTEPPSKPSPTAAFEAQATYLIAGGLGGFGLATARWMVERGARHLVLLGRSGAASKQAQQGVAELHALGATVRVFEVDIVDYDALHRVFETIAQTLPRLRGVIHAAMILDDGLVRNLEANSLRRVMAPKIGGAWNLHRLTEGRELDFFVLYSSATTCFGNPGQANYVAANMYLESLARFRRAQGLPAVAACWGPIADVGYLAQNEDVRESLEARLGGRPITSSEALGQLERLLAAQRSGVSVVDLDWRVLRRVMPGARAPKFGAMTRAGAEDAGDRSSAQDIRAMLAELPEEERADAVTELLTEQVAQVLRTPADKVDSSLSIHELGMDSLMAVELVQGIEERFGVDLPVMAVTEGASVSQMAARLATQLVGDNTSDADANDEDAHHDTVTTLILRHGENFTEEEKAEIVEITRKEPMERKRLIQ